MNTPRAERITRPETAGWSHSPTWPHLAWLCFLPRQTSRSYMPSSVLLPGHIVWAKLSPDNPRGPRNRTALVLSPDSHSWESREEFLRAHVFQFQPWVRASMDAIWASEKSEPESLTRHSKGLLLHTVSWYSVWHPYCRSLWSLSMLFLHFSI